MVTLALVTLTGCGHSGTSNLTFPDQPQGVTAAVTGVVLAPNGDFAAADRWLHWPDTLRLVPPAYALQNVLPAQAGLPVSLSRVDFIDAADGQIDSPVLIAQADTDDNGLYQIVNSAADDVDACRLMVAVGGGRALTRGFVFSHTTNIDAVSEAVVRVVLDRLMKAPPVQLCDFTSSGLAKIYDEVWMAAFTASGDSVATINQDAFKRAKAFQGVTDAIESATGVPVANP